MSASEEEERLRREWFYSYKDRDDDRYTMRCILDFFKQTDDDVNNQLVIEYYTEGIQE